MAEPVCKDCGDTGFVPGEPPYLSHFKKCEVCSAWVGNNRKMKFITFLGKLMCLPRTMVNAARTKAGKFEESKQYHNL